VLLTIVIWPPKPVDQSLVTSNDAEAEMPGCYRVDDRAVPDAFPRLAHWGLKGSLEGLIRLGCRIRFIGTEIVWLSVPG